MNRTLSRLIEIVPPPQSLIECGDDEAFKAVEEHLGLSLPEDYKEYIAIYGSGVWHGFWWILNPFSANENSNLIIQSQNRRPKKWSALDAERAVREAEGRYPHSIYPEPGGILPWAFTDRGGRLFWQTKGKPSSWKTIYHASRDPSFEVYDRPCTSILLGVVTGEHPIFADLFSDHEFQYGKPYDFSRPDAFVLPKSKRKGRATK